MSQLRGDHYSDCVLLGEALLFRLARNNIICVNQSPNLWNINITFFLPIASAH